MVKIIGKSACILIKLYIDGTEVQVQEGSCILEAAEQYEIYIPSLCYHPDLPSFSKIKAEERVFRKRASFEGCKDAELKGCDLCLVDVEGYPEMVRACDTNVIAGMKVFTNTNRVQEARRERLSNILSKHPHACLVCTQKEGCDLESCSLNVPKDERCCDRFGNCELEKIAEYIGIKKDTARYIPAKLGIVKDEPLFIFNYNLCINCTRCVRACQSLRGVHALGLIYLNNETFVGMTAPTLINSGCRFCGSCVEVCPTGAIKDKDPWADIRNKKVAPCVFSCPLGIDAPSYLRLIAEDKFAEASAVIRGKAPFLRVLGYICHHPCEHSCCRNEVNEPIAIAALKRFVAEKDSRIKSQEIMVSTGKKVAIIGSGPAGLTAAYYLTLKGHTVTVFEKSSHIGGMLYSCIPRYRLPTKILQKDLEEILSLGIEVKTRVEIGEHIKFEKLHKSNDAIFIGIGAQKDRKLMMKSVGLEGVWFGLDLLKEINLNKKANIGKEVLVIGGGDVAVDVARTTVRLGARTSILYRRSRNEMRAQPREVKQAEEEGVNLKFFLAPKEIIGKNEHVFGLKCLITRPGELDESRRRIPIPIEGSEFVIEADTIVIAIGATPDLSFLNRNIEATKRELLDVNPSTMETSLRGVFAGGDVVSGPSSVVEAIAMGKTAAGSIDRYLGGDGNIDKSSIERKESNLWLGRVEKFAEKQRLIISCLPIEQRQKNFDLVELSYSEKDAREEVKRCLQCDLRFQIHAVLKPPEKWFKLEANKVTTVPTAEGTYQLFDEKKEVIYIKGTINLRKELEEHLATNSEATHFAYEEAKMYTARESELLQQFLKKHGKLPKQNLEIDDLY